MWKGRRMISKTRMKEVSKRKARMKTRMKMASKLRVRRMKMPWKTRMKAASKQRTSALLPLLTTRARQYHFSQRGHQKVLFS